MENIEQEQLEQDKVERERAKQFNKSAHKWGNFVVKFRDIVQMQFPEGHSPTPTT